MFGWNKNNPDSIQLENNFKVALNGVQTAIMMIDRDLKITYVNHGTKKLLKDNLDTFKKIWPNFDAENIVGQCIDQFHKDPSRQRTLLSNPSNLPFNTDIQVGDLSFSLTVSAQTDNRGNYIGNTLEWENVTELRKHEKANADYKSIIEAMDRSQAMIEFDMQGNILKANNLFLDLTGYTEEEIIGKHHSLFVEKDYKKSAEYKNFWEKLNQGKFDSGEYQRLGNNNKKIWIRATYNPITDTSGKLFKVVKVATDITYEKAIQHATEKLLNEAKDVMSNIAAGDLTHRMSDDYDGEFKELSSSINSCAEKLTEIVDDIKSSTDTLNNGIAEISRGNMHLSQQTESQARSLETTSHSMEEMTSTVKNNAENAQHASELAISTREHATQGGEVVNQAVNAMQEISSSSMRIADIISVIDEIAFQTNLLALNAAVEAARAGDQGRGFAVVASEVRNLAGRSATAAKEIKSLIEDSVSKVEQGTTLVNQSGKTLEKIVEGVRDVSQLVNDIAEASREQASGIGLANNSISEIEKTTQQNTALVEESAASSETMNQQSGHLYKLVSYFTTHKSSIDDTDLSEQPVAVERRSKSRPWNGHNGQQTITNNNDPVVDTWQEF